MQETWVQSLGREDPLEKEMATHSSIHAWKIPWTTEPGGLQSMGSQRVGQDLETEQEQQKHSSDKKQNQANREENKSRREGGICFSLLQTMAGDTGKLLDEQLLTPSRASLGAQW